MGDLLLLIVVFFLLGVAVVRFLSALEWLWDLLTDERYHEESGG